MPNDTHHADELAAFTDQLLAGKETTMVTDDAELVAIVRQLYDTIAPDETVSDSFKTRLGQRLAMEWDLQYQRQMRWWAMPRLQQIAIALVASIALVIAAILLLSSTGDSSGGSMEGAVSGPLTSAVLIAVVVASAISLIVFLRRSR